MQHPQHPTLNPAPWLGRAQCPHPGGPTGHGWLTGGTDRQRVHPREPDPAAHGASAKSCLYKGQRQSWGSVWDGSCRARTCAKGRGRCRRGAPGPSVGWPTGGAWGSVSRRTAPRADTRAHTQRGGIPTPRLPTAPLGAVSGMWETHPAGGHGASPEPRAPLRPASPSLPWGGSGLLPEGDGGRQGSWRPHGTSGTAWGAGRCRNGRTGMLAHGPAAQHLPCPSAGAGTHRSS